MLSYARLAPGPGFRPLRAALYFSQRLVVHPRHRRWVARAIATGIRVRQAPLAAPAIARQLLADARTAIDAQGLAMVPDLFEADALRDVQDWLAQRPVVLPDGSSGLLTSLPAGTATAPYALSSVLQCPHVLERANDPTMLALAQSYLGCKPTLSSIGIRWSLPTPTRPSDVQSFHRDPDDWRFVKLFVYLTDVDAGSGPHVYATASHRVCGTLRARLWTRQAVEDKFGARSLVTVSGPAGTTFMADTYGIHAGSVPASRPRLILQVQYSVLPVYAFRYEPVRLVRPPSLDAYVNRLIVRDDTTG